MLTTVDWRTLKLLEDAEVPTFAVFAKGVTCRGGWALSSESFI
jgi:hypothetical protein